MGRSALHVICNKKGNLDVAEFLISQDINVNLLDSKERSPLYLAIESGNFEIANLLSEVGGEVECSADRLAKMLCQFGSDDDVDRIALLHKCKADLQIGDYDSRTVGHLAAADNNTKTIEYLAA